MGKLLAVGEVLWDLFPDKKVIGGAPFNVAVHAAALGLKSYILTRLGNDGLGRAAYEEIIKKNVLPDYAGFDEKYPTGTAKVTFYKPGIPQYDIPFETACNYITVDNETIDSVNEKQFDFVCFGTMVQRNPPCREHIWRLLKSINATKFFFDVNFRQGVHIKEVLEFSFNRSDIVKINDEEADIISEMLYGEKLNIEHLSKRLTEDFSIEALLITLGEKGCFVYSNNSARFIDGQKVEVADTVGAGDAFSAGFISEYLKTGDIFCAAQFGNRLGAYVASVPGATPEINGFLENTGGIF